jgi:hypothetical protein
MLPRCPFAQSFQAIVQESIRLPEEISPELLARVLQRLTTLYNQLQASMSPTHYPSVSGRHYCLKDAFKEGVLRVQNLAAFPLPKPEPPPAPAVPPPKPRSLADVVRDFRDFAGSEDKGE